MVLTDQVDDMAVDPIADGEIHSLLHMREDDQGAHGRSQFVVGILPGGRVFGEILWLGKFTNVVEIGANAAECGIGTYLLGAGLSKISESQRVMVGPGGLEAEAAKQRMIQIGHLQPGDIGGDTKELLQERQGTANEYSGK